MSYCLVVFFFLKSLKNLLSGVSPSPIGSVTENSTFLLGFGNFSGAFGIKGKIFELSPPSFILLVYKDPINHGLVYSLYNWVVFHPPKITINHSGEMPSPPQLICLSQRGPICSSSGDFVVFYKRR